MFQIASKEFNQFFSSITGFLAIALFLFMLGLVLFVFPDTNMLSFGYANIDIFFNYVPWILLFLIPSICMKSFADEYKQGSYEILKTLPLTPFKIVIGKFLGCFSVVLIALLPTVIYPITMQLLSDTAGIDVAAAVGSYVGLILLSAVFTIICICASSYTNNAVIAFLAGAFICFILFSGFEALSKLSFIKGKFDYLVEVLGINFHYKSMSKGLISFKDLVYFLMLLFVFGIITKKKINS